MKLRMGLLLLSLMLAMLVQPSVRAEEPVAHVVLFWSATCPHCHVVLNETMPRLQEQYGPRLDVLTVEASTPEGYQLWLEALETFQVPDERQGVPMLIAGDQVLVGEAEIAELLPELIEASAVDGGLHYPELPGLATFLATATPAASATAMGTHAEPTAAPAESPNPTLPAVSPDDDSPSPIHMAYFYQPGCRECDRVALDLNYLKHRYPQLLVHDFDVESNAALAEWLGQRAAVPEGSRLTAPAVFVGDDALVGESVNAANLEALIARYEETGATMVWDRWESAEPQATASIVARFRSLGVLTVLAAGLVDGLNPCAFATIVFFISYLAFMERKGREILAVGGAFALGVFLAYTGVGFGLLKFLTALPFLSALSRWIYGLTAIVCLVLAGASLYDWWQARSGRPQDMQLKLPTRLRKKINQVIREGARMRAFVAVALLSGVVISLIELACTGQVYLPTIVFVLGVPELQAKAGLYLVLYNLMFILPLVVVFMLAYFGVTSQKLGIFIHRRAATIKLLTAGLFIVLAVSLGLAQL